MGISYHGYTDSEKIWTMPFKNGFALFCDDQCMDKYEIVTDKTKLKEGEQVFSFEEIFEDYMGLSKEDLTEKEYNEKVKDFKKELKYFLFESPFYIEKEIKDTVKNVWDWRLKEQFGFKAKWDGEGSWKKSEIDDIFEQLKEMSYIKFTGEEEHETY